LHGWAYLDSEVGLLKKILWTLVLILAWIISAFLLAMVKQCLNPVYTFI
jgi:hypothetical protein